ncbi:protein phosphatase 2C domain-containing protein [Glycomyces buryatensis]|uniref:Protein phosphatase 2C domain-containing protein n=1 Tax=Glycomyces buryatensis TaxID=2570927 RepID=A0A4S8QFT2_9ACTN|nr:protein phosphatase 2C domain-containing protein [Glycomyces buryatensis]THV43278.1 protein phosphatase 2C domain-containing protein [Glycomyces buryatensis]
MTDRRLDLATPAPRAAWGDREGPWIPDTIGRTARAAEAAWKPDPDPRFPDTVLDHGTVGDITAMACAARGAKHRFEGTSREDAAIAVEAVGSWALAAVADGVGSVHDSRLASEEAVRVFARYMSRRIADSGERALTQGSGLFGEINRALGKLTGPKTTLTVAVVAAHPDGTGRYPFWAASVGDSPAYLISEGETHGLLIAEREDEFGTATAALPNHDIANVFKQIRGELLPGEALMLVSDGIGDLMASEGPQRYFADNWGLVPSPLDLMRQVQVRSRGFDDDRSAAVLWAVPENADKAPSLRPSAAMKPGGPVVRDVELSAAQTRGLEVRAAAARGAVAAAEGRARRSRVSLLEYGDRLVAIATAPVRPDAAEAADLWARTFKETADNRPLLDPFEDWWAPRVWTQALRSLSEKDPNFDSGAVAATILCVEPASDGMVDYTLSHSAGLSASIAGAGLHRELAELRSPEHHHDYGEHELWIYSDRLAEDQTLLLTYGIDPACIAEADSRPGPLQTFDVVDRETGDDDQFMVAVWGAR